ncbi:MAG: hypothetical protein NWR52_05255 [Paracoccaceae bacterium]|nr:hypothetical protein [Paracoccaceae bacterium]
MKWLLGTVATFLLVSVSGFLIFGPHNQHSSQLLSYLSYASELFVAIIPLSPFIAICVVEHVINREIRSFRRHHFADKDSKHPKNTVSLIVTPKGATAREIQEFRRFLAPWNRLRLETLVCLFLSFYVVSTMN